MIDVTKEGMIIPVVIICKASSQIGLGHVARCMALAEGLSSLGFDIHVLVSGDNSVVRFCERRLEASLAKYQLFAVEHFDKLDFDQDIQQSSAIILDIPNLNSDFLDRCFRISKAVLALDYFKFEGKLPSCIVNVFDHSSLDDLAKRKQLNVKKYYEGLKYSIVRPEFIMARRSRCQRGERADVSRVLVSFGGSDPAGNYLKAIEMIKEWPNKVSIDLVIGPLFRDTLDSLCPTVFEDLEITVHKSVVSLCDLMLEADIVLCGGGGTLLESMTIGVPSIVFHQTNLEKNFSEFVASNGGCWLSEAVLELNFLSGELRSAQSEQGRNLVDGQGIYRIGNQLQQLYSTTKELK